VSPSYFVVASKILQKSGRVIYSEKHTLFQERSTVHKMEYS
jgi:hypothetical protein